MNTEDYIEMISQTDFLDMDKVNRLSLNISIYPKPFVAIGQTTFGHVFSGYAFTPMTDSLEPKYPDSDSDVLGLISEAEGVSGQRIHGWRMLENVWIWLLRVFTTSVKLDALVLHLRLAYHVGQSSRG